MTERPTDTLETLGVHGPTVVAAKPVLRVVEFITDCRQPRMTSLFAFKQIVTVSYLLQTTDFVSMCVGLPMVLSVRHHGPVHENRGAESEQETFARCPFVV